MKLKAIAGSLAFACTIVLLGCEARADALYQTIPDLSIRPLSDGLCSACASRFQVYQGFELASAADVTSITLAVDSVFDFPTGFTVKIYDAPADLPSTSTLFDAFYPTSSWVGAPVLTDFDTAVVTLAVPSLRLEADHTYTISFVGNDFALPTYSGGPGPVFQDGGPNFPDELRHEVALSLPNNSQTTDITLGFMLSGQAAPAPEPSTWALMLVGLGSVGAALRDRRQRTFSADA